MDFSEPESWARMRALAERFAAEHVTRDAIEAERRSGDGVNREITRALAKRGWIVPAWPVTDGGAGLDPNGRGGADQRLA